MPSSSKTFTPDGIDIEIINLLAENARQPVSTLASQIGMSAPSITERIKRLEEHGVISRYTIEVNLEKLGFTLTSLVRVKPLPGQLHQLEKRLTAMPACIECDKVTGEDCFIIRLVLRSIGDLDEQLNHIVELAETSSAIVKKSPVPRRLPALVRG
ncbi:Lrp/AsnC family transcriptional regulator [Aliamphritea spongicola]|uniref:Lrp/AsnC family transcriptional regulator n=1 Tax=Aliamphritea spongicola TaxID=707589 RepID=UPI00196B8191|nr:Lrp/AsnC family transcriptional regulator [Aliamphritea spongicola]MBN3562451.1 Lrp/AsnC family transcriptional regulator [Aliamphritea spongicola]